MTDMKIMPAGDAALIVEFGRTIDEETNKKVQVLSSCIRTANIPGVREILPTFRNLMVCYDPAVISFFKLSKKIRHFKAEESSEDKEAKRTLIVPCCYGGKYGSDLAEMSAFLKIGEDEIIRLHGSIDYKIYMLGFLPGFVYLGGLDERIHMPRLEIPRVKIPARSVGIGGSQTGVYPMDSPGGWRLIGSTPLDFYAPEDKNPVLCKAGEYIRFVPISESEYEALRKDVAAGDYRPEYI